MLIVAGDGDQDYNTDIIRFFKFMLHIDARPPEYAQAGRSASIP